MSSFRLYFCILVLFLYFVFDSGFFIDIICNFLYFFDFISIYYSNFLFLVLYIFFFDIYIFI